MLIVWNSKTLSFRVKLMPRNRLENVEVRQWVQASAPDWTCVWDRTNSRRSDGPRDCWYVWRVSLPCAEAWSVVWVRSPQLTLRREARRRRNIAATKEALPPRQNGYCDLRQAFCSWGSKHLADLIMAKAPQTSLRIFAPVTREARWRSARRLLAGYESVWLRRAHCPPTYQSGGTSHLLGRSRRPVCGRIE
jgi:hypothetical protein